MTPPDAPSTTALMLGRDHETYGRFAVTRVSANTFCALGPGADAEFAATTQKEHVNEDALFVFEDARHTLMCVADAHFGRESSERLIQELSQRLRPVPQNPEQLAKVFTELSRAKLPDDYGSETTLTVCILDRLFRQAFGLSFGDSSIVHAVPGELPQRENESNTRYVTLAAPRTLAPAGAVRFEFSPKQCDLLMVFTDGIDECCYRDPDRSIGPEVLHELLARTGFAPETVTKELTELALTGVDGNPGGQDNIALAVTRV